MRALYNDQSSQLICAKLNRRMLILWVVTALLLGVFVSAMIVRIEWLAMVSFCMAGCFAVFFSQMFCAPLMRYRRLINAALHGRHHTKDLEFARLEPDVSVVEGVPCRTLVFLGDPDKHGSREMRLYWDQEIPLPSLEPGMVVPVEYTDKFIIGIQREAVSSRP